MKALEFTFGFPKKEECDSWFNWFAGRGIPAAIIRNKTTEKFHVYRQGALYRKTDKTQGWAVKKVVFPELDFPFEVIDVCNGFDCSN